MKQENCGLCDDEAKKKYNCLFPQYVNEFSSIYIDPHDSRELCMPDWDYVMALKEVDKFLDTKVS